jgi:hypothetical protein
MSFLLSLVRSILVFVAPITLSLLTSCQSDPLKASEKGNLSIEFENRVGNQALKLDGTTYTNAHGESYTVRHFLYYVSNFALTKKDGSKVIVPESYFLIDQDHEPSRMITLKDIPAGDYVQVSFLIGIDSARNMAGAQAGALDPLNGMFWSWNSGYIFVKIEGNSPQSGQPYNKLQFHIGGFTGATNCIRTLSPSLNGNQIAIRTGKTPQLHYQVDMARLFDAPSRISFATLSAVHGGPNAVAFANNYQNMITFKHMGQKP